MGLVTQNNDVQNEMDIIRSYSLMRKVVDSLHLNVNIYKEGRVTASAMYGAKTPVLIKVVEENPEYKPESLKMNMTPQNFTITEGSNRRTFKYGDTVEIDFGKLIITRNTEIKIDPKGFRVLFTSKEAETKSIRAQ